ncbi:MAG: threonylcarbamoyl-AMP synthase [Actinomycetales bacterium]|nr:threonylcarbamoyl-AMP synthase [Actinomycetales bacterium]
MRLAKVSLQRGELVVLPTDTVYGIAANAFDATAVAALLEAKGRGRQSPPPVLIPSVNTLPGLATDVPEVALRLAEAFWPGALTMILKAQPSLIWDLGETRGTVALRVPNHKIALALLEETGPLAVSSANLTGEPAAVDCQQAADYLGKSVAVYLDAGAAPVGEASTILDLTALVASGIDASSTDAENAGKIRVVRQGAISREQIAAVAGNLLAPAVEG